jgi:hypothetical protein
MSANGNLKTTFSRREDAEAFLEAVNERGADSPPGPSTAVELDG